MIMVLMGRWSISFRSSDFNGDDRRDRPKRGRRQPVNDLAPPLPGEGQHLCPRGTFCASSTRDTEGTWHPLMVNSAFCPADESAIANALPDLPRSYYLLAARIGDPVRSGRGIRRPPGSRVLVNAEADALLRTSAAVIMGWAARVRAVPGLQLSPGRHLPDKPEGVRDNCGVLARHVTQLLALAPGPTVRTWTWPPDTGMPDDLEAELGDLEVVHAGDGWATAVTDLSGVDAGLEVLDLAAKFRRVLGESPTRPETLDGVPCRECEELALVEADPPHDPKTEKDKSKCTACNARMSPAEYAEWTKMYDAWVKGAGLLTCRLCELKRCGECRFMACDCAASGHRAAAA
jgi:hypothetical protein